MTSQARMATGIKLMYNDTVYAEIVGDITEPPFTVEKVDTTSHDSTYKVSIPGQAAWGDLKFSVNFIRDTAQIALRTAAMAKTVGTWVLVYPPGFDFLTYSIPGFISGMTKKLPLKGAAATWEITITPSEAVLEASTAGYGLTTTFFSMLDNDSNALTPVETPAATTYMYNVTAYADDTSFTITPIAANGTIYVDGTVVASTVASSAIGYAVADYPSGSYKTVFIVVERGGSYVPSIYQINVIRGTANHP